MGFNRVTAIKTNIKKTGTYTSKHSKYTYYRFCFENVFFIAKKKKTIKGSEKWKSRCTPYKKLKLSLEQGNHTLRELLICFRFLT
jgi:hypothetical protein